MPRRLDLTKHRSAIEEDKQVSLRVGVYRFTRKTEPRWLNEYERASGLLAQCRQHPDE